MDKEVQHSNERENEKEEILMEIGEAIRDCFVGVLTKSEDGLTLALVGGQKFKIQVSKIA